MKDAFKLSFNEQQMSTQPFTINPKTKSPKFGGNAMKSFNINTHRAAVDLTCGDPYYNYRQEMNEAHGENIETMNNKLDQVIGKLEEFPSLKR